MSEQKESTITRYLAEVSFCGGLVRSDRFEKESEAKTWIDKIIEESKGTTLYNDDKHPPQFKITKI